MPAIKVPGLSPVQLQPNLAPNAQPASGKTLLVVAALGVGGYLLYRHFKKSSTVELSGTDPVEVDDDDDGEEE